MIKKSKIVNLKIGSKFTNDELMKNFVVDNMKGMRYSTENHTLVLISSHKDEVYQNLWIAGNLHYIGEGKMGDQKMTAQNKRLRDSNNDTDLEVHLFETFESDTYIYRGLVQLIDSPYQTIQLDENDTYRKVWVFPLRPWSIEAVQTRSNDEDRKN